MTTAMAIFVKTPGRSPVKTRLAHGIGINAATTFHRLAARAVAEVARAAGPGLAPYWAVAECGALDDWPGYFPRLWQGGGGLGERMDLVYALLRTGCERVLLVGADVPQVTPALLQRACSALADPATPFVMGDAADGGFWLFGGREPVPRNVWCSAGYSCSDTASQLREFLRPYGRIAALPTLTDVDRPSDLPVLAAALAALPALLPAQRELLARLRSRRLASGESFSALRASMT